jgi:hypothetical protein
MATEIYKSEYIHLINGERLYVTPLKIKYLRELMDKFNKVSEAETPDESITLLSECVLITMIQYCPTIRTVEDVEDTFDMDAIYKILEISAGINLKKDSDEEPDDSKQNKNAKDSGSTWDTMDLAALESEVFLLGIWKDYEDLETSLSLPELMSTLNSKREAEYQERKFLAAIQGVDLDEHSGKQQEDPWEAMKARVFSGGATSDPNDITSLQGTAAAKAGFGIGNGLSYEKW